MTDFSALIAAAAAETKLSADLIAAVVQHESAGKPMAIGDDTQALGLMQVHSAACKQVGVSWEDLSSAIHFGDSEKAASLGIQAGTRYLAAMMKAANNDARLALMMYNQGPTVIGRAVAYAEAVLALEGSR